MSFCKIFKLGNALSSFREEMIDTINNRINLLNKFITEKITFLANASRAVNKVEVMIII